MLWRPVADATATTVREALTSLFVNHGAPLVLKSDNGSAFIAEHLRQMTANFQVKMLFSPAHTPSYNGSIEASIGSLTTRTEQHAARHGRPGLWTWDDDLYDWLAGTLDVDTLRRLLPEAADLAIERYELANLSALNFVVLGLLGQGVASSVRFDPQAKGLGEYVRSRRVDLPTALVDRSRPVSTAAPAPTTPA